MIRRVWQGRLRKGAERLYQLVCVKTGRNVCHPETVSLFLLLCILDGLDLEVFQLFTGKDFRIFLGGVGGGRGHFSFNIFSIQIRRLSASWGETQKTFPRKPGSISEINGMKDGKSFKNVRLAGNTGTFLFDIYFLGMRWLF